MKKRILRFIVFFSFLIIIFSSTACKLMNYPPGFWAPKNRGRWYLEQPSDTNSIYCIKSGSFYVVSEKSTE